MKKTLLILCLLPTFATGSLADTLCREPDILDFGPAVTSRSSNTFVITQGCSEDSLLVRKPVSLAIHFGQSDIATEEVEHRSTWTVLFDLDRDDLSFSAQRLLYQIPEKTKVQVTGYTCPMGSEGYNLDLSRHRAENVASYLRDRGVIILQVEGRGECCPVSASDFGQNRRVQVVEDSK